MTKKAKSRIKKVIEKKFKKINEIPYHQNSGTWLGINRPTPSAKNAYTKVMV